MDFNSLIGIGGFVLMLALIMLGVPIFLSMLLPAIIGFWILGGSAAVFNVLTTAPFNIIENYTFAVIPLFVVMGELAAQTGLARAAFDALNKWVGRLRGGLLMATVGTCAIFGAVSSTPLPVTVLSVKVALPELMKQKYDKSFCLAAIATTGVLATLIPPSTPILIFCILTNLSIGRALVAGIVPGVALTLLCCLTIWVEGKIYRDKVPVADTRVTWKERFASLRSFVPILLVFMLIVGGIYLGIFSPPVGGAIGATAILVYALIMRVEKQKLVQCFWNTCVLNASLFPMILAGFIFSRFIAFTNLADFLIDFVVSIQAPPLAVMAVIIVAYILISFPLDLMPVMIITIPIFFPLLTGIGFDPFVLVIVLILIGTLGEITPPIGMSIYVVASMAKVNVMDVYRGVIPWFIIIFIFVWIVVLWPPMTTWLPNLFYG